MIIKIKGKKPVEKRRAGQRAGLKNAKIISTASRLLETTRSLKIQTLAEALGVGPTTIRSHFRGGASQICAEIAREALGGAARPYRPRDTPNEYLAGLFWGVQQKLSGKPMIARLVAIELSWNPLLDPRLAERILVFIEALGFEASYFPRGLNRVIAGLSDMILTECAQSNEARQETAALRIASSIERLDPDEFPTLVENKEALLKHARLSAVGPPRREIAAEYAAATLELLKLEIERAPGRLEQRNQRQEADPIESSGELGKARF